MSTIIVAIGILLITGAIITDVAAIAPTKITNCSDSSADGQRLVLMNDISNGGDCILIYHDNVILDCRRFTLDGGSAVNSIGVKVTADGVTVKNCMIEDFSIGIKLENSDGGTVTKNTLTSNDLGINLESGSEYISITANTSIENRDGIRIVFSNFNEIERNTLIGNSIHGIRINGSDSNIISLNDATENTRTGIMLLNNADSNTIEKNTSNNNRDGISVCDDCDSNILTLNTANSNVEKGFVDLTSGTGTAGTDNTYEKNRCTDNMTDSEPLDLCR